jgi:uncharacterized repeat protein (TIGR01451 family)
LMLDAPKATSEAYFNRAAPANLVVNGDFESFTNPTLLQPPFNATLIGPNVVAGAYTPSMTNKTTVPGWTATGGNASSYAWHTFNPAFLSTPQAALGGAGGYIYLGDSAQNLLAGGAPYHLPFTADTSPQGRILPPGPITVGPNTFSWRGGFPFPTGPVAIEQIVNLTVGRNYRMTFFIAAEMLKVRLNHTTIDGIMGLDISGYNREYLMVPGYDNPLTSSGTKGTYYTLEFTAKQSVTTVRFLSYGHATAVTNSVSPLGAEPTLDDVVINACDPAALAVSKTGNKSVAEIGDTIAYTVVTTVGASVPSAQLIDNLPVGFRYITGSATIAKGGFAAVKLADPLPTGNLGPQLTFQLGAVSGTDTIVVSYKVRAGVGAKQGDGINRARVQAGTAVSSTAQFQVKIIEGVFTSEGCVAGKVFVDCNNNHIQDAEELGIPGVRLYMEDGTYFVTDSEGKYSYCGLSPKSHAVTVDLLTMPRGARLTTTSNRNLGDGNSMFLDVKNGQLIRADFAEGSCSNTVLEQVKARRTQGEVRSVETEKTGQPALKWEGKSPQYPQQGTEGANQPLVLRRSESIQSLK